MPQAAQEVRGESGDLLQAPEHREEPPGGDVPDCQRLRAGGGHRSGSNSESSVWYMPLWFPTGLIFNFMVFESQIFQIIKGIF